MTDASSILMLFVFLPYDFLLAFSALEHHILAVLSDVLFEVVVGHLLFFWAIEGTGVYLELLAVAGAEVR